MVFLLSVPRLRDNLDIPSNFSQEKILLMRLTGFDPTKKLKTQIGPTPPPPLKKNGSRPIDYSNNKC